MDVAGKGARGTARRQSRRGGAVALLVSVAAVCLRGIEPSGAVEVDERSVRATELDCLRPTATVVVAPGESVQAVVDAHPAGTRYLLAAGTHRLQEVRPKAGDAFIGELDADCRRLTTMSGSVTVGGWVAEGGGWVSRQPVIHGPEYGRCQAGWGRCQWPEDLFLDGRPLRHEPRVHDVGVGEWHFDLDAGLLRLGEDPAGREVELSQSPVAFHPTAPDVLIHGLVIERYASLSLNGAIGGWDPPPRWTVKYNEVRQVHGAAVAVGDGSVVTRNHLHDNGQIGVTSYGSDLLIARNVISGNNYARFTNSWEAGGVKLKEGDRQVVQGNCVHDNDGPGLWSDLEVADVLYERNVVFDNVREGIFHEISGPAVVRHNRVGGNGEWTAWLYGAQILISTSSGAQVHGNQVEVHAGYGNGIAVIWQDRPPFAAVDNVVHDNDVTFLGSAAMHGVMHDFAAGAAVVDLNVFRGNRYHTLAPDGRHFRWGTDLRIDLPQLHGMGQEVGSTIDGAASATAWDCSWLSAMVGSDVG